MRDGKRRHMPRRSRRERDLYRYRPDDAAAQREAAERMKAGREGRLREVSEEWEASIRRQLEEAEPLKPVRHAEPAERRRRRNPLLRGVMRVVRVLTGRGGGSRRR